MFSNIKEKLEYKKIKLKILKNNLNCLKNDRQLMDKFYIDKMSFNGAEFYEITQSKYSLSLLFEALKYPDAKTCFFVALFNLYQNLEGDVLYQSDSQSLTTYCLQLLAKYHLIDLNYRKEELNGFYLNDYARILGNYDFKNENKKMHRVYFYKLRSLREEDLPIIKNIANFIGIDFKLIDIKDINGTIYLDLKKRVVCNQIFSLEYFKKMFEQRKLIVSLLKEYKDYIFEDYNDYQKKL